MLKHLYSCSEKETTALGENLGRLLDGQTCILLSGDLGTGKTTFTKGLARGLSVSPDYYITSPTYNLINEYPGRMTLYHVDLYRLETPEEIEYIGFDELFSHEAVIAVEWPEILLETDTAYDFKLRFVTDSHFNREISLFAAGQESSNLLQKMFL